MADPGADPTGALQALRASTSDLLQALDTSGWSDADVAAPSLCPGWSRGHVLTHLARNADGIAATLGGTLRGELVARYPDGDAGRDRDIEAGADRPFAAQVADLREAVERLDRVLAAVHDAGAWEVRTDHDHPAHEWVGRRLREVEIHHVDLDAGYHPRQWPPLLVADELPGLVAARMQESGGALRITVAADSSVVQELVGRSWSSAGFDPADGGHDVTAPDWALLAWLLGRGATVADDLGAVPV